MLRWPTLPELSPQASTVGLRAAPIQVPRTSTVSRWPPRPKLLDIELASSAAHTDPSLRRAGRGRRSSVAPCDSSFTAPSTTHPNLIWRTGYLSPLATFGACSLSISVSPLTSWRGRLVLISLGD